MRFRGDRRNKNGIGLISVAVAAVEKYGDLGKLIELGGDYQDPAPNAEDYNLDDDPHGLNLDRYKQDMKEHRKAAAEHRSNASKLYATICNKLSVEAMDEVRRHEDFSRT
jgi:antirestriction protein